ncbi:hypothetical protein ACJIZ3_006669 [Penstemon smallii]|uniref:RING-type domain-containing protein n=1 Tax=Penstemon smallii TaxID=265156 RepID=A0ABD3S8C4_9LAMI
MDGVDRNSRRKSLKERLGLKGMACCGATWGLGPTTISVNDDDEEEEIDVADVAPNPIETPCFGQSPATTGMNLAAALAAERQLRESLDLENGNDRIRSPSSTAGTVPGTPSRVSLMRLLEEADGYDGEMKKEGGDGGGSDSVCCVCMGRKKGAAFIPCGHTFCRVCSRELWLNRGNCPLCNLTILEILDIY